MSDNENFLTLSGRYIFNTYGRNPVMLVEGSGTEVRDSAGRTYLDFIGGIAACTLGHGHEELARVIGEQARRLIHVSNLFHIRPQIELARLLVENSFAHKAFFCNSGAEANEGAIKLVRRYFSDQGTPERFHIITMENSFHGRTLATLAATGQTKYRVGFGPVVEGFSHVPFGDIEAVAKAVTPQTAAIMVEPIQGESGVRVPPTGYLKELRSLCDKTGCLLVLDEVQTAMGRTGRFFAHEHFHIRPDVVTMAKGIAGGVPMGALLAVDEVARAFVPGTHASTFGGNPLASAAAVYVVEKVLSEGFLEEVSGKGRRLRAGLEELAAQHPIAKEARGLGLMQALELNIPAAECALFLLEAGFLVNCAANTVLRFLPPLVVTTEQIDHLLEALDMALKKVGGA